MKLKYESVFAHQTFVVCSVDAPFASEPGLELSFPFKLRERPGGGGGNSLYKAWYTCATGIDPLFTAAIHQQVAKLLISIHL